MKLLCTICLCLFGTLSSSAQYSQLTLSNDFKIAEKEYKDQTVTNSIFHKNEFYTATNSGLGGYKWLFTKLYDVRFAVTVAKYDRDMNLIKEVEIDKGEKKFGPLAPELIHFNNTLFLAYFKSAGNTSFDLYLSAINEPDMTLKEPKKICTIEQENVGIFKIEGILKSGLIYTAISPDGSKMLVASKNSPGKLQTTILDGSLNMLKQSSIKVKYPSFDIPSAVITPNNQIALVVTSEQETSVLAVNAEGKSSELKYAGFQSLKPYNTRMTLARDGNSIYVTSTAIQSEEENQTWCRGLFMAQIDCNTMKMSKPVPYEFTPEFIQEVSEKGGGKKHKREFFMYNFAPMLVEQENGDPVILGSPQMITVSVSTSAPDRNNRSHQQATTTMNAGPIVAFYPEKKGKSFEKVIIPRSIELSKSARSGSGSIQLVSAPGLSNSSAGFVVTSKEGKLVIIYNDNATNLSKDPTQKIVKTDKASELSLAEAVIDSDKQLQYRKVLSDIKKGRSAYMLGNAIPTTSTTAIIFPVGKDGVMFNGMKTFYTNWCFLTL